MCKPHVPYQKYAVTSSTNERRDWNENRVQPLCMKYPPGRMSLIFCRKVCDDALGRFGVLRATRFPSLQVLDISPFTIGKAGFSTASSMTFCNSHFRGNTFRYSDTITCQQQCLDCNLVYSLFDYYHGSWCIGLLAGRKRILADTLAVQPVCTTKDGGISGLDWIHCLIWTVGSSAGSVSKRRTVQSVWAAGNRPL